MYDDQYSLSLGGSQIGLALKAALVHADGTIDATHRDLADGFVEIGGGMYFWSYGEHPTEFVGDAVFYVGAIGGASNFNGVALKAHAPTKKPASGGAGTTKNITVKIKETRAQ